MGRYCLKKIKKSSDNVYVINKTKYYYLREDKERKKVYEFIKRNENHPLLDNSCDNKMQKLL